MSDGSVSEGPAPARFSIVILTWNRHDRLRGALEGLHGLADAGVETIVVDNGSTPPVADALSSAFSFAKVVRIPENRGTGSRNAGIREATGDFIICLDDDVHGIDEDSLRAIEGVFSSDARIGAICFRVLDELNPALQINWCHDYPLAAFADRRFVTDEISEGAVAFRASAIQGLPMFPSDYFISHEGVAVAYQLMNAGYRVVYEPTVSVVHATAPEGRKSWRRYYYDTRNNFWLVAQYFSPLRGVRRLGREVAAMSYYSARDGFFKYWLKGVVHGLRRLPGILRLREPPTSNTKQILKQIDRERPSLVHKIRARLNGKGVRI